MDLKEIRRDSLSSLIYRSVESKKIDGSLHDPTAEKWLEKILAFQNDADKEWFETFIDRTKIKRLSMEIDIEKKLFFDALINKYIAKNPGCIIINLEGELDTRYWRIDHKNCTYFEVDTTKMSDFKKKLFEDNLPYTILTDSVTDEKWMNQVSCYSNENILIVAEDIFMSLSINEIEDFLQKIERKFIHSDFATEIPFYGHFNTLWNSIIPLSNLIKMKKKVIKPKDIEMFGSGIKLLEANRLQNKIAIQTGINHYI